MKLKYLFLLYSIIFLNGCKGDKDIEEEYYGKVEQFFSKNFISEFGKYPSSHTWSTCLSKSISVSASGMEIKKVYIYSSNPLANGNCYLMADRSVLSFNFDVPANLKNVFIIAVTSSDRYFVNEVDISSTQTSTDLSSANEVEPFDLPSSPMEYYIAYDGIGYIEDLDFNDVILSVSHVSGQYNARFTLYAAGCTDPVEIFYQQDGSERYIFREIHSTLGEFTSNGMINTISSKKTFSKTEMTNRAVTNTFNVGHDLSINDIAAHIIVKKRETPLSYKGNSDGNKFAPMAIIIANPNWEWPTERTKISTAYPRFAQYVIDETNNYDWCYR